MSVKGQCLNTVMYIVLLRFVSYSFSVDLLGLKI